MAHKAREKTLPPSPHAFWIWGFAGLLALLPLPFGTNRPWASDLMGVLTSLLLLSMLWHERTLAFWRAATPRRRLVAAAWGISLVVAWSLVQIIPWTPASWHHPLWQEAKTALGSSYGAISLAPGLALESLCRFLSFVACFLLAFHGGKERSDAAFILKAVTFAGTGYALYGLLVTLSGSETILWFDKWAYKGFLTSTFVNKNSYATYCGLGLLCALAHGRQTLRETKAWKALQAGKTDFLGFFEALSWSQLIVLLLPVLFMTALVLTGSRAGLVSAFAGILVFFLAFGLNKKRRSKKNIFLGSVVLTLLLFFVLAGSQILVNRLAEARLDAASQTRLTSYALALEAVEDNPWLGFGLGTFEPAFRLYRDISMPFWHHRAHNDYLEMMMDLGLPAAFLLFCSLGLLISCCFSGARGRRKDVVYPVLALGASALVGVHSLADFSLHIPAVAATYAALLGLGVTQSWSREKTAGSL